MDNSEHAEEVGTIVKKTVDLEDPTSLLDQVYRGCTQRAAQVNNRIGLDKTETVLEADQHKYRCQRQRRPIPKTIAWSYDVDGHAQLCVERYCECAHKTIDQLHEDPISCRDDDQIKPEDLEVGRVVRDLLSNYVDMLVCGKNWKTRSTLNSPSRWNRACDL